MNLQHAVQHSVNISLVRLHTNKPAGTCRLIPTRYISTFYLPVQSEPRAKRTCSFAFVVVRVHSHLWMLETLSPYLHQLGVLVLKRASVVRTIKKKNVIFMCTNKLEYVN